jgi:hypothetical protein
LKRLQRCREGPILTRNSELIARLAAEKELRRRRFEATKA